MTTEMTIKEMKKVQNNLLEAQIILTGLDTGPDGPVAHYRKLIDQALNGDKFNIGITAEIEELENADDDPEPNPIEGDGSSDIVARR